jgi:chromosome segregation ATPase
MNELDGVPSPLRPLAAQLLAAVFPWFAPAGLKRAINAAGERERCYLAALTRGWTAQHWAALSEALSCAGYPVQARNADEAFSHVAMRIVIEQATFEVCWPRGAIGPCVAATSGSRALSPADLAVRIKQITADIDRVAARGRVREAMRKLFLSEQQRSRAEADAAAADLAAWRVQLAGILQRVDSCSQESRVLFDQRQDVERARSSAIATASEIAVRGATALNALSRLQDQRDTLLDQASSRQASELDRVLELEQAIDSQMAAIENLKVQANEQLEAIRSQDDAIKALKEDHRETAEMPFDAAVKEAKQLAEALRRRRAELADSAAAERERQRIATAANQGDEPELVMAQLDALDLWQLGRAPDHARKRACSEAISTLETALNQARANWQRPSLEHGG